MTAAAKDWSVGRQVITALAARRRALWRDARSAGLRPNPFTQAELAKRIDVSPITIGNWEQGRCQPHCPELYNRWVDALHCAIVAEVRPIP